MYCTDWYCTVFLRLSSWWQLLLWALCFQVVQISVHLSNQPILTSIRSLERLSSNLAQISTSLDDLTEDLLSHNLSVYMPVNSAWYEFWPVVNTITQEFRVFTFFVAIPICETSTIHPSICLLLNVIWLHVTLWSVSHYNILYESEKIWIKKWNFPVSYIIISL